MNVLIVDDEPLARQELRCLLEAEADIHIVDECGNAIEAIKAINHKPVDVVFLDIQMPRISGLEMIGMLDPDHMPRVVFLTAHDEYAVRAFEERAYDYLLKPIDSQRLAKTLQHLRSDYVRRPLVLPPEAQRLQHIPCAGINRIFLLKLDEVESVASNASGVYVIGTDGKENFTELTLRTIEERTPLLRCHKQFLINPDQIKEIRFEENGVAEIITISNRNVPVSRRFLGALRDSVGIS